MNSRGLIIGAVGALAASGALAADLPVRKAAPVDFVRACTQYGPGFFFIPGTDTCLRASGLVRADFVAQSPAFYSSLFPSQTGRVNQLSPRAVNVIGMQARGQIDLDARTATPYGALRTFLSYRLYAGSLTGVGANPATGDVFTLSNFGAGGLQPSVPELGRAYVEFAGFTAGRAYSFFNLPYFETFSSPLTPDGANTMFAYTARFGQGWSLTVAAEDAGTRRSAVRIGVGSNDPDIFFSRTGDFQAGNQYPMFVGALAYDNPMYSVQLSGAVRQVRTNNQRAALDAINGNPNNPADPVLGVLIANAANVDDYGFAVQLGGQVRLPFIAAGDKLYGGINYTEGLTLLSGIYNDEDRFGRPTGGYEDYDGTFDVLTGRFVRTKVLSGHLGYLHYWAPTVRSAFSGSIMRVDDSNFGDRLVSYDRYRALANLVWSPVAGLDIGAEFMYDRLDFGNPIQAFSFDQYTGTVRVQRRF